MVDFISVHGAQYMACVEDVYTVVQADDGQDYRIVMVDGVKKWKAMHDWHFSCEDPIPAMPPLSLWKPVQEVKSLDIKEVGKKPRGRPKKDKVEEETPPTDVPILPKKVVVKKGTIPDANQEIKKVIVKKEPCVLEAATGSEVKKKVIVKKVHT